MDNGFKLFIDCSFVEVLRSEGMISELDLGKFARIFFSLIYLIKNISLF